MGAHGDRLTDVGNLEGKMGLQTSPVRSVAPVWSDLAKKSLQRSFGLEEVMRLSRKHGGDGDNRAILGEVVAERRDGEKRKRKKGRGSPEEKHGSDRTLL